MVSTILTPDRFKQAHINQNQCCKNGGDHRFFPGYLHGDWYYSVFWERVSVFQILPNDRTGRLLIIDSDFHTPIRLQTHF